MPIQALLAAILAFLAAAFTVLVPWEAAASPDGTPAITLFQWLVFWAILAGLGVGLGRGLDEPVARLIPFAPTALLLLVVLAGDVPGVLELGRMRLPVPVPMRALGVVALSGLAWYAGVTWSARALRQLEDQARD